MKKLILSLFVFLLGTPIFALPFGLKVAGEVDNNSRYVFRGAELSQGFTLNPNLSAEAFGAEAYIWSNVDLDPANKMNNFNEVDYGVGYSLDMAGFNVVPYFHLYTLTDDNTNNTAEFQLTLGYTLPIPLMDIQIFTRSFIDVMEYSGSFYNESGVSFSMDVIPMIAVEAEGFIGMQKYTKDLDPKEKFRLNSFNLKAALTLSPMPLLYFRAHVMMTQIIDEDLQTGLEGDLGKTKIYGGIAVGLEL
ncbi:hypothetical protein JXR93_10300 [bacterium]|nr:hypothetical protein [bacterium]